MRLITEIEEAEKKLLDASDNLLRLKMLKLNTDVEQNNKEIEHVIKQHDIFMANMPDINSIIDLSLLTNLLKEVNINYWLCHKHLCFCEYSCNNGCYERTSDHMMTKNSELYKQIVKIKDTINKRIMHIATHYKWTLTN